MCYLIAKYIRVKINTIIIPKIVNHFPASVSINLLKVSPNLNERYEKVKDDPDITKLQKLFGANINKESIKKIIE